MNYIEIGRIRKGRYRGRYNKKDLPVTFLNDLWTGVELFMKGTKPTWLRLL